MLSYVLITLCALVQGASVTNTSASLTAKQEFENLSKKKGLNAAELFKGFRLQFSDEHVPKVFEYGQVRPEWKDTTYKANKLDKIHEYVKVSYQTDFDQQLLKSFPITISFNAQEQVLLNVSREVHSSNLTYLKQVEVKLDVTSQERSFIMVFQCLDDGDHTINGKVTTNDTTYDFSFKKMCGKAGIGFINIEMLNEKEDKITPTKIQSQEKPIHEFEYKATCGSFEMVVSTTSDASVLLKGPRIDYQNKSAQSQLIKLQTAEFRGNDKNGGLLEASLPLYLNIKFVCLKVSEVRYTVLLESQIFEAPISFMIVKVCEQDQIEEVITNFTQFPVVIGTAHGLSDVYRPGQVAEAYNRSSRYVRIIPAEQMAEKFFISVMKNEFGEELFKRNLKLRNPILEYNRHILDVIHDNPRLPQQFWRKPVDILLIFRCKLAGKDLVQMELDFTYGNNKTQTISLSFVKVCEAMDEEELEPSFLSDVFYYTLCLVAILFGLYIIKVFKRMPNY